MYEVYRDDDGTLFVRIWDIVTDTTVFVPATFFVDEHDGFRFVGNYSIEDLEEAV